MKNIALKTVALSCVAASCLYSNSLELESGWHLLGTNTNISNTSDVFPPNTPVWKYSDGDWIQNPTSLISGDGFWVFVNEPMSYTLNQSEIVDDAMAIGTEWTLAALKTSRGVSAVEYFGSSSVEIAWKYQDGVWEAYSSNPLMQEALAFRSFPIFNTIEVGQGFWVKASDNTLLSTTRGTIERLLDKTSATLEANVTDAKHMINQLRQSVVSFVDFDNIANSNTIVGNQYTLLETNIKPQVDNILADFNTSATSLQTSVESFSMGLSNFDMVLGEVDARLRAISEAISINDRGFESSWSFTTPYPYNDTLSKAFTRHNDTSATEVLTLNGQSITIIWNIDGDNAEVTRVDHSGDMIFNGNGYSLTITDFRLEDSSVVINGSGHINGANNSSMTLANLSITSDVVAENDGAINMIQNLNANFDGTIVSNGRTLQGKLSILGSSQILEGIYTGSNNEPTVSGKITLNTSMNTLINDVAFNDQAISGMMWSPLVMVNFSDGTKSMMTSYSQNWYYDEENNSIHTLTINTANGQTTSCNLEYEYLTDSYSQTINCANGASLTTYKTSDGIISLDTNQGELFVGSAWTNYSFDNNQSTYTQKLWLSNLYEETYFENGKIMLNGNELIVNDITMLPTREIFDREFNIAFDGNIIHNSKRIEAKFGINKELDKVKFYGSDLLITDGVNSINIDKVGFDLSNDEFFRVMRSEPDYHMSHYHYSYFENYTVNYGDHYHYFYENERAEVNSNEILSASLQGFGAIVKDSQNYTLGILADIKYSNINNKKSVVFDGSYNYKNSEFEGYIAYFGQVIDNEDVGTANVFGKISSNGFVTFDINTYIDFKANNELEAVGLFRRGESYQVGIKVVSNDTNNTIILGDNKGVFGTYESSNRILNLTNKNNNSLGTMGENNRWEIVYSDNSSETIF